MEIAGWSGKLSGLGWEDVTYAIITDFHFDHSLTDGRLCKRIIAHESAYKGIQVMDRRSLLRWYYGKEYEESKEFFDNLDPALPQIMLSQQLLLSMGDCSIELVHMGGHTLSTIMVYVPADKIAFLGDNLVSGQFPFTADGKFGSWIDVLARVEQMDVELVVPGHGEVCDKRAIRELKSYFESLREQIKTLSRSGLTKDRIVERVAVAENILKWEPLPGLGAKEQVSADAGRMYDQMEKGLL